MGDEVYNIGLICDDLKSMGEYRAVALIDWLIDENLKLADENFEKSQFSIKLFEALEEAVKALELPIGVYQITAAKKARAFIAKAKGEEE